MLYIEAVLIVLKLMGVLSLSWPIVLIPFFAWVFIYFLIGFLVSLNNGLSEYNKELKEKKN